MRALLYTFLFQYQNFGETAGGGAFKSQGVIVVCAALLTRRDPNIAEAWPDLAEGASPAIGCTCN